ncbi:MAG: N-acetyltransferase family protein, partial [Actinomycetes bacterium]
VAAGVSEQTFVRLTGPDPSVQGLVAVDGDELVGLCHLVLHHSTWTEGPYCYLEDLFVRPDRRLAGAGRALIASSAEVARRAGASKLYWQTHGSNAVARHLYDAVATHRGFLVYEVELDD